MTMVLSRLALVLALFATAIMATTAVASAQDDADTLGPAPVALDDTDDSREVSEPTLRESEVPIRFGGQARLVGQLADRAGLYQQVPDDYARFEMTPTLFVYDVPFAANVLLSTEESTTRQGINSVVFGLDFNQLQGALLTRAYDKIGELQALKSIEEESGMGAVRDSLTAVGADVEREVARLKDLADFEKLQDRAFSESMGVLQQLGVVSATEKFFASFPALEIGVTYPQYTPLTLTSVPVTGANIEFNPGQFYVAVAGGRSQRSTMGEQVIWRRVPPVPEFEDTVIAPTYNRALYAGRIGYGKKDAGNVILTAIYARDDRTNPPADSVALDTLGQAFAPKANYVVGVSARIPIEDMVTIEGEIAGAVLTGDLNSPGFRNDDIPGFLIDMIEPTISTSVDFSYALKGTFDIAETGTRLIGSARMVGPGYSSFGAPTLRTDNLRYDARIEQRLIERQVLMTAFYRADRDNLVDWKPATTSIDAWGVGLGLNFRRLPYLRLNYAPYHQANDISGERAVDNTTQTYSAITGYSFKTGALRNSATLSYSGQASSTLGGISDYSTGNFALNYAAYFSFPLTLNAGVGISTYTAGKSMSGSDSISSILTLDLGGSFTAFDIWEASAGVTMSDEENADNRFGFFLGSTVALWENGFFEVRAERNVYDTFLDYQDFSEAVVHATVSTRW